MNTERPKNPPVAFDKGLALFFAFTVFFGFCRWTIMDDSDTATLEVIQKIAASGN